MERVKDRVFTRPIVYGNTARFLGKKREEDGHTHEWTVFVKPYYNDDPSKYIRKVQFKLHDSYANATRSKLFIHVLYAFDKHWFIQILDSAWFIWALDGSMAQTGNSI